MYKGIKSEIAKFFNMSKENKYGSYECATAISLLSCIPDRDTKVICFANNEDEGVRELKYDMHTKSIDSCRNFFKNQAMLMRDLGVLSEEVADDIMSAYDCARSYFEILNASFRGDTTSVPFEVLSAEGDGVVITAICRIDNGDIPLLKSVCAALEVPCDFNDDEVAEIDTYIKENDWVWGFRYEIPKVKG